jgi:chromosome segregation ATPase
MDAELKEYLDGRFGAIDRRLEAIDKRFGDIEKRFSDIEKRFSDIDRRFAEVFERIDAVQAGMFRRMDEMAATLEEHFREQQTEVLKAAFTMQENIRNRLHDHDGALASVRERMEILERRLFEIEKRLLMPPQ